MLLLPRGFETYKTKAFTMTAEDAIQRAERYLQTADLVLEDGDLETCVSRSYYAMFYVARELLQRHGSDPDTHQGTINQFGLHLVKNGPVSAQYGRAFREIRELREFAEYAEERVVTDEDAETALKDAKAFVERMSELLRDE